MQRAQLRVGRAAPDARVDEVAPVALDREAARVAGEPFGGLAAERPGALDERRLRRRSDARSASSRCAAHHRARRRRCWASVTSASAADCCHSRTLPVCLSAARCCLAMSQIACSKIGALLERQPAAQTQLAPPTRPRHAQRPPRIQRLVVGDHRRRERPRGQPDRARRLADRDPRQLGITLRRRELRSRRDLIERQRARAHRMVERRQAPQARRSSA